MGKFRAKCLSVRVESSVPPSVICKAFFKGPFFQMIVDRVDVTQVDQTKSLLLNSWKVIFGWAITAVVTCSKSLILIASIFIEGYTETV